ncbi:MAG: ComEC/Rec2 family competence protein [Spirochaetia bacterium]
MFIANFFRFYHHGAFLLSLLTLMGFGLAIYIPSLYFLYIILAGVWLCFIYFCTHIKKFWITLLLSTVFSLLLFSTYRLQQKTKKPNFGQNAPIHTIHGIILTDVAQQDQFQSIKVQMTKALSHIATTQASGYILVTIPLEHPVFFKGQRLILEISRPIYAENIYGPVPAKNLQIGPYTHDIWKIRAQLLNQWRKFFTEHYPQQIGLMSALLWADRSALSPFQSHDIRKAGISHLLALSGMHLAVIIAMTLPLLSYFFGKKHALIILIGLMLPYLFITGFPASLLRAYLAFVLGALIWISGRDARALDLWGSGVLISLAINPLYLFSLGWQLSFAAVLGIICLQKNYANLRGFFPRILANPLSVGLAAMATTTPILAIHFSSIHPQGLIATLMLTPLLALWMIMAIVGLIIPLLQSFFIGFDQFLWWLIHQFSLMGSIPSGIGILIFSFFIPLTAFFFKWRIYERNDI